MTAYDVLCSQSDEAAWKANRRTMVTASLVPTLLGLSPWEKRSVADVLRDVAIGADLEQTASMEGGNRFESTVLGWCGDRDGRSYRRWQELLRSREAPWLGATPDGFVEEDGRRVLVEVKCTHPFGTKKEWAPLTSDGPRMVPDHVQAQVQAQLFVAGLAKAYVIHWSWGVYPQAIPVERNDRVCAAIVSAAREAWETIERIRSEAGAP
ncbi:MAG: YqaJ viral recombinase family protein [Myxococcota bacterium]